VRSTHRGLVGPVAGLMAILLPSVPALAGSSEGRPAVAVFEIAVRDLPKINASTMPKFLDLLEGEIARSGFQTVPRTAVRQVLLDRKSESYRECFDEACQIELGKAVAAAKVAAASWSRIGGGCIFELRMFDLRTELNEQSLRADAECTEDGLRAAIEQVGRELRARQSGLYGDFQVDLEQGARIKNPPTDRSGYLKISVAARGRPEEPIEIYVNGAHAGTTAGGLFTKELGLGHYVIILRAAGGLYGHRRFDVDLGPAGVRIPAEGTVELESIFGTLEVRGTPDSATLLLNGEPRPVQGGVLKLDLRAGEYELVVEAPGFIASQRQRVRVQPGLVSPFRYALAQNAGSLVVEGEPQGAEVFVDERSVGRLPLRLSAVGVGDHVVDVRALGHHSFKQMVTVGLGGVANVRVGLIAKRARLKVEALSLVAGQPTAVEAEVIVDGRSVGTTPWKGEVHAERPVELQLRLGSALGPKRVLQLIEGEERREELTVPPSWAGATASVFVKLPPGTWDLRSGPAVLVPNQPNPVRPGTLPLELVLDGQQRWKGELKLAPGNQRMVIVAERPKTAEELAASQTAWFWRRWGSLAGATVAVAGGSYFLARAHNAAAIRDEAFGNLMQASLPEEVDVMRRAVSEQDQARVEFQGWATGVFVTAAALGAWSAIEWLWGEPNAGTLESDVFVPVEGGSER
jgi:hypothetical protein